MTDTICNDTAYQNMIAQRRRFQLLNIPPMRYNNLDNNPYENTNPITGKKFTKFDLDMRRKAEILKYKANNTGSQTNNLTKAEVYAQAVSGKYQQRTYPHYYMKENTSNNRIESCSVLNVKTPTSSSDVPGRIIDLYEDVNVPLYNYNNTMIDSNFGFSTQGTNPYNQKQTWNYHANSDVPSTSLASDKLNANVASIFIYYADVPSKTFAVTTPITLKVTGSKTITTQDSSINFTITSISTKILFNNNPIATITTTSNINNNSSQSFTIPITTSTFSINHYLGLLNMTNMTLPFQKGYIFDIQPEIAYTITPSNATVTSNSVVFNVGTTPTQLNGFSYQATSIMAA